MDQKGIGISNLPNMRYRSFCKAGTDLNIMTAGSCGLGKSSFINQMFEVAVLSADPFLESNENAQNYEVLSVSGKDESQVQENKYFHKEAALNVQVSKFFMVENEFQTRVSVTEVDGIGDSVCSDNCWEHVVWLIEENFKDFLGQERKNVRSLIKDKRYHVCFYFLEPTPACIRMVDIKAMKEISKMCNLIPIVGKSDILNTVQRQNLRNLIVKTLFSEDIDTFSLEINDGDEIKKIDGPFFVISKGISQEGKNERSERMYPWGTVSLKNVEDNDFRTLVDTLISKNFMNIMESTEGFYDCYKAKEMEKSMKESDSESNDRRFSGEIQKRIQENEKAIMEMKQRLLKKRRECEVESLGAMSLHGGRN